MSAIWQVGLRCNGCGQEFGFVAVPDRNDYLAPQRALREMAARKGWTFHQGTRNRRHLDHCPKCARGRQ